MRNVFVAMCKFSNNVMEMTHQNCNLFKRSYTDKGIGFTFNNGKKYRTMTLLKIALHCMQLAYNLLDSSDESQTTSISCKRSCFLNSISRVQ